jgi:1-acyl-sn-glycerol-3-phosphate acyltransferase
MNKNPEPVRRWTWPHYWAGAWAGRTICRLAGGFAVRGRENIPMKGGAAVCANHISYLDPPVLGGALPRRTYFMAKKELFEVPLLGSFIRKSYAFPVDRGTTDREAIRHGIEVMQQGELLIVFPEGGRSPDGSLQPGNVGPALMAARAGVPIIPAAIKETDRVLPLRAKGFHRGHVQVDFGAPIYPAQFGGERLDKVQLQAFTEAVMQAIEDLQKKQYERVGETAPPRVKELPDA